MKSFEEFLLQEEELDERTRHDRDKDKDKRTSAGEMRDRILEPIDRAVSSVRDKGKDQRQRLIHEPIAAVKNKVNSMKTPGADYSAGNPGLEKLKGGIKGAAKGVMNMVSRIKNPLRVGTRGGRDQSRWSSEASDNLKDASGLSPGSNL